MGTTLYVVADAMYIQSPLLLSPLLQFSPLLPITVPSVTVSVPSVTITVPSVTRYFFWISFYYVLSQKSFYSSANYHTKAKSSI